MNLDSVSNTTAAARATLASALTKATEGHDFKSEKFFPIWFRELGTPYFFVFKKNLSITNLPQPELLALIRQYTYCKIDDRPASSIAFHTTAAFTSVIESIVDSTVNRVRFEASHLHDISQLYWPIIENAIVVDQFFTSCAVFVPPHFYLDLERICAESGYIHNCGYSLYVRKISKAIPVDFYEAINRHLTRYPQYEGELQFIPFDAEDFSDDKDVGHVKDAIQDGLDGIKLRVEKLHMQHLSLVELFQDMEREYDGRLLFRGAGSYRKQHPETSESTLWLITDRSANRSNPTSPGGDGYYICYHQLYHNENPFHLFDENKPAWVAHNTIPHTLLGSMINITKPWPRDRHMVLRDPFGGTGTTWLESKKHINCRCVTSDINNAFPLLVADNISFFSLHQVKLATLLSEFNELIAALKTQSYANDGEDAGQGILLDVRNLAIPPAYRKSTELISELKEADNRLSLSFEFSPITVRKLAGFSFFERLVFYVSLRAELRYQYAYARGGKARIAGFVESARYLIEEMESFLKWCSRARLEQKAFDPFSLFSGHYSKSCGVSYPRLVRAVEELAQSKDVRVSDARSLEPSSCDILITDPPYGVNTEEDIIGLSRLYSDVVDAIVRAVRNEGHIVLCLPSETYSGKKLPVCTAGEIITSQLLCAANTVGRELYSPAKSSLPMANPPYYWISKALRRSILHFRIRNRQTP